MLGHAGLAQPQRPEHTTRLSQPLPTGWFRTFGHAHSCARSQALHARLRSKLTVLACSRFAQAQPFPSRWARSIWFQLRGIYSGYRQHSINGASCCLQNCAAGPWPIPYRGTTQSLPSREAQQVNAFAQTCTGDCDAGHDHTGTSSVSCQSSNAATKDLPRQESRAAFKCSLPHHGLIGSIRPSSNFFLDAHHQGACSGKGTRTFGSTTKVRAKVLQNLVVRGGLTGMGSGRECRWTFGLAGLPPGGNGESHWKGSPAAAAAAF